MDIVFHGRTVVNTDGELPLQVPHPRYAEREFVLSPLMEVLEEGFVDPQTQLHPRDALSVLRRAPARGTPPRRVLPRHGSAIGRAGLPMGDAEVWPLRGEHGGRTLVMGVLNLTPDSFSDGGQHASVHAAVDRATAMVAEGADVIDVGGESTRPGADPVAEAEELRRVVPVIDALRRGGVTVPLSVDTTHAAVARAALSAGAHIVNDVSGGAEDPGMLPFLAESGAPCVLMHMRGTPRTMQGLTQYGDVARDVAAELAVRVAAAEACGVPRWSIVADPGIGFAKTQEQNLLLLRHLPVLAQHPVLAGLPLLVGASRKGFIGAITGRSAGERVFGTAACNAAAVAAGALFVRVHDVAAARDCAAVAQAIAEAGGNAAAA